MTGQRFLISADLEGVAGVVASEELRPGSVEYETARTLMTDEVNAAIRGIFAANQSAEVLVVDGHGNYRNILIERLDPRARLLRGRPRNLAMVQDVDRAGAILFIGYHARAGQSGLLCHTFNDVIRDIRCNGRSLGEVGLNAAVAGEQGAPLLLATGDDALVGEVLEISPGTVTVSVKRAVSAQSADSLHPSLACQRIEDGARTAVLSGAGTVVRLAAPISLQIDLVHGVQADLAALPPPVVRLGPTTVGVNELDNAVTAYRWVRTIVALASSAP